MGYKEPVLTRVYYKLGEVANMIGVPTSTIRYWQIEFDFNTSRTKYNKRQFTPEQVRNVLAVNYLLNIEFYTIRGAKIKY
jgi:DNA-binding transcriptional MerR regulator